MFSANDEHKYCCSHVNLPIVLSYEVAINQAEICEKQPGSKIETNPHFTILYGLKKSLKVYDIEDIRKATRDLKPFTVKFGDLSYFSGVEDGTCDCVFVSVADSIGAGGLYGLRKRLYKFLDADFQSGEKKPYVPHVTLCYVPLNKGKKWHGEHSKITGKTMKVDSFTISLANGEHDCPLMG